MVVDGQRRHFSLDKDEVRIGRGPENDVVLADFSVSRNHALLQRRSGAWTLFDLQSTNGVRLNGKTVEEALLKPGDRIGVGAFELEAESLGPSPEVQSVQSRVENASIIRPLAEFTAEYGLQTGGASPGPLTPAPTTLDEALAAADGPAMDAAYAHRIVGFLTRLAGLLISADSVDQVLERAMGLAFEALSVERGFILLQDDGGEVRCELARNGEDVELRPQGEVPVSQTIVESVMEDQVALLTHDALSDSRLALGDSIRLHGIRSALCVPLWSGEKVIGVMQVDSPMMVGHFQQQDLDFLTAVANYAAVAVERLRYAGRIKVEQELRARLERYHSPAVIEEVLKRGEETEVATLRTTEATVLFADMVGFTARAEEMPPEDVASLLRDYFNDAAQAIFEAGGTLDKFIGDCVMAFFGAPIPQEDHALRAVKAAQKILEVQERRNQDRKEKGLEPLSSRIAVNSGPVVVGDVGSDQRVDYTVLGNTVNVAARLEQTVAQAGQLVVGPGTQKLLRGAVPMKSLGVFRLKGLQQSLEAFEVPRSE